MEWAESKEGDDIRGEKGTDSGTQLLQSR